MFNESEPEFKVKYDYFRHIFNIDYNIEFGRLATDSCSFLIQSKGKIKISVYQSEKAELWKLN